MQDVIAGLPNDPEEALVALAEKLQLILVAKREKVRWKLHSVYQAFSERIRPVLRKRRRQEPAFQVRRSLSGLYLLNTAPIEEQSGD